MSHMPEPTSASGGGCKRVKSATRGQSSNRQPLTQMPSDIAMLTPDVNPSTGQPYSRITVQSSATGEKKRLTLSQLYCRVPFSKHTNFFSPNAYASRHCRGWARDESRSRFHLVPPPHVHTSGSVQIILWANTHMQSSCWYYSHEAVFPVVKKCAGAIDSCLISRVK